MRASEFTSGKVMAKIERTGQIVQILRHADQVRFSDEPGWFLINTEPGRRTGTSIKWIPDSTRFAWVKNFESLKETKFRIPRAIEEFLDSLNPDDCGVEDIGTYRIHFEGFTSDCKSSADYRRNPEAVYQQVYRDFIQREGGQRPVIQDMTGDERFPILYSIFRRKKPVTENTTATARQVLNYINKTHHEPFRPGEKMYAAVMAHPEWQLQRVPLLNLNIPDQEYDDVDYDEYEPEADPYGRVMVVEPGHAGEVSQHLIDRNPIVIDADRYIIDGNHRAWAAKYLLNRDYIMAWVPVQQQVKEVNYPDELTVSDRIQEYFYKRGYQLAGEGRDQMAFESPRGTIVKVLGTGETEREDIVKNYVKFFQRNQRNPYYPRIYSSGNFTVDDETYFVYEMEYLTYVSDEEEVLEYIEDLMASLAQNGARGVAAFQQNRPLPKSLSAEDVAGLVKATYDLEVALGGQAPLDLSQIENIRRRSDGHLVIMDPYSL